MSSKLDSSNLVMGAAAVQVMHAGYPMIDDMLALLQASSHVYVDLAGLIWSYPLSEVNRYIERLVTAGFQRLATAAK